MSLVLDWFRFVVSGPAGRRLLLLVLLRCRRRRTEGIRFARIRCPKPLAQASGHGVVVVAPVSAGVAWVSASMKRHWLGGVVV